MSNEFDRLLNSPLLNMSNISRYSGTKLIEPESVADHVSECIGIAINLFLYCQCFNLERVIYFIGVHDIGECFTGDIVRPVKYYNTDIHKAINGIEQELLHSSINDFQIEEDINRNAKSETTIEGMVVAFIDRFQCVLKLYREYKMSNSEALFEKFKYSCDVSNEYFEYVIKVSDRFDKDLRDYLETLLSNMYDKYRQEKKLLDIKEQ